MWFFPTFRQYVMVLVIVQFRMHYDGFELLSTGAPKEYDNKSKRSRGLSMSLQNTQGTRRGGIPEQAPPWNGYVQKTLKHIYCSPPYEIATKRIW